MTSIAGGTLVIPSAGATETLPRGVALKLGDIDGVLSVGLDADGVSALFRGLRFAKRSLKFARILKGLSDSQTVARYTNPTSKTTSLNAPAPNIGGVPVGRIRCRATGAVVALRPVPPLVPRAALETPFDGSIRPLTSRAFSRPHCDPAGVGTQAAGPLAASPANADACRSGQANETGRTVDRTRRPSYDVDACRHRIDLRKFLHRLTWGGWKEDGGLLPDRGSPPSFHPR